MALPGTPEQLAALAKDFKVYYKKVEGKTPTSYTMDHSAAQLSSTTRRAGCGCTRATAPACAPMVADVKTLLASRADAVEKKPGRAGFASAEPQAYSASAFFIFFIAATSIWRMRSADTP